MNATLNESNFSAIRRECRIDGMAEPVTSRRRWFQFSVRVTALILTAVMIWKGHWLILAFGAFWGTVQGLAISVGMRRATPDAWARQPHALTKLFVVVTLMLLLFWPVPVAMLAGGIALGVAEFLVISLAVTVVRHYSGGNFNRVMRPSAPQS
jgi:hypothetical protein